MQCALLPFVQEMRKAYAEGFPCRNHATMTDFLQHALYLFTIGDFPGQGKMCAMAHAGGVPCHFCDHPFPRAFGTSGGDRGINNRRNLDENSPMRADRVYGKDKADPALNRPAKLRTHAEV